MENPLSPADIAARYQCSLPTARKRMRQMKHFTIDGHLFVTESDVRAFEGDRTTYPGEKPKARRQSRWEQPPRDETGRIRIPRRRA